MSDTDVLGAVAVIGETDCCKALIERREHALVALSPFNTLFGQDYINAVLHWAGSKFDHVDVIVPCPDEAARVLRASGTAPGRALRKARKEVSRLTKCAASSDTKCGVQKSEIRVLTYTDFADNEKYFYYKSLAEDLFDTCLEFRESCIDICHQAISGRRRACGLDGIPVTEHEIAISVPYVFSELPFYVDTPALLGLKSSVLLYHKRWSIGSGLFSGNLPMKVAANQGFGLIRRNV